ncbi:MAG TPA: hypothetical protein VN726_06405 [Hanamia sp.]|nr:hypothetical protein [Hanamia sp.]
MIKPNELRIGNCYLDICGEPNTWTIDSYKFYHEHPLNGQNMYENINPIPLTPEILEKCGFTKGSGSFYDGNMMLSIEERGYALFCGESTEGKSFKYLHQLQNLYSDLYGIELEINF